MPNPNPSFDYNVLNRMLDILGLSQEDKTQLAKEIISAVTEKSLLRVKIDTSQFDELAKTGDFSAIAQEMAKQVDDPKKFAEVFTNTAGELLNVLIDEFRQIASPEQTKELDDYLAEYKDKVAQLGLTS